mmetsp:Transcript_478/g.1843  ORF Transcript_478/g.1843 Transcript_478/m.1843 type:complete len:526 (+) Transcript_478:818-2395(+)
MPEQGAVSSRARRGESAAKESAAAVSTPPRRRRRDACFVFRRATRRARARLVAVHGAARQARRRRRRARRVRGGTGDDRGEGVRERSQRRRGRGGRRGRRRGARGRAQKKIGRTSSSPPLDVLARRSAVAARPARVHARDPRRAARHRRGPGARDRAHETAVQSERIGVTRRAQGRSHSRSRKRGELVRHRRGGRYREDRQEDGRHVQAPRRDVRVADVVQTRRERPRAVRQLQQTRMRDAPRRVLRVLAPTGGAGSARRRKGTTRVAKIAARKPGAALAFGVRSVGRVERAATVRIARAGRVRGRARKRVGDAVRRRARRRRGSRVDGCGGAAAAARERRRARVARDETGGVFGVSLLSSLSYTKHVKRVTLHYERTSLSPRVSHSSPGRSISLASRVGGGGGRFRGTRVPNGPCRGGNGYVWTLPPFPRGFESSLKSKSRRSIKETVCGLRGTTLGASPCPGRRRSLGACGIAVGANGNGGCRFLFFSSLFSRSRASTHKRYFSRSAASATRALAFRVSTIGW